MITVIIYPKLSSTSSVSLLRRTSSTSSLYCHSQTPVTALYSLCSPSLGSQSKSSQQFEKKPKDLIMAFKAPLYPATPGLRCSALAAPLFIVP